MPTQSLRPKKKSHSLLSKQKFNESSKSVAVSHTQLKHGKFGLPNTTRLEKTPKTTPPKSSTTSLPSTSWPKKLLCVFLRLQEMTDLLIQVSFVAPLIFCGSQRKFSTKYFRASVVTNLKRKRTKFFRQLRLAVLME